MDLFTKRLTKVKAVNDFNNGNGNNDMVIVFASVEFNWIKVYYFCVQSPMCSVCGTSSVS